MKELIKIQSELKSPKNQFNSFGKYNYRSCEDILEALKPLLLANECKLILSDEMVNIGERYYVKATATITSENDSVSVTAFAREEAEKKGMDLMQLSGATSSYARKYALNGLFLIDDNKDSDTTNKGEKSTLDKSTKDLIDACKSIEDLKVLWELNSDWHNDRKIQVYVSTKKKQLK